MNDTNKDELIAEYTSRQAAIDNASQQMIQIFGFSIAAIVTLFATSIQAKSVGFLVGAFIIVFISASFIFSQTRSIVEAETYLIVFTEFNLKHLKWNQRLFRLCKGRKNKNSKAIFSSFAVQAYAVILFLIAAWAIYTALSINSPMNLISYYPLSFFSLLFAILLIRELAKFDKADNSKMTKSYYYEYLNLWKKEKEKEDLTNLNKRLSLEPSQAKLVESDGEETLIPESTYPALRQVIHLASLGQEVSILPKEHEVTMQEAADLLNMPQPFLIKLVEEEKISHIKVGSQRHIRLQDLMAYKEQQDATRSKALDELIQMSQDEGFYENKLINE